MTLGVSIADYVLVAVTVDIHRIHARADTVGLIDDVLFPGSVIPDISVLENQE